VYFANVQYYIWNPEAREKIFQAVPSTPNGARPRTEKLSFSFSIFHLFFNSLFSKINEKNRGNVTLHLQISFFYFISLFCVIINGFIRFGSFV